MENKEDLQFKRAESYTSTRKTAGASQRGLTSGREDGRRRGLRERERHVQRRRPDLGASPATAAAACKHEATCKSATSRNQPGAVQEMHPPSTSQAAHRRRAPRSRSRGRGPGELPTKEARDEVGRMGGAGEEDARVTRSGTSTKGNETLRGLIGSLHWCGPAGTEEVKSSRAHLS